MGIGSIGLREVRGVEGPEASSPDFTAVTVCQAYPSDVKGKVQNWVSVAGVDKVAHRVVAFSWAPWSVHVPLISLYIWKLWLPKLPWSYWFLPDTILAMQAG
jgi:hypothetical protein